jgi:alpha-tubulin suppressor-like RCC1 family protein
MRGAKGALGLLAGAILVSVGCNTILGVETLSYDGDGGPDAAVDGETQPEVVALAAGPFATCAVRSDGTLWCWGFLFGVDLSDTCSADGAPPCAATPKILNGLENVRDVTVGRRSVCALLEDGTVRCWGDHQQGQLGVGLAHYACGTETDSYPCEPEPREVEGLEGVKQVVLSPGTTRHYGCAVLESGKVKCWGVNDTYQLANAPASSTCKDPGIGDLTFPCATTPVEIPGLTGVDSLSLSDTHACALMLDRTLQCWGVAQFGQLGMAPPFAKCTYQSFEAGATVSFELDCVDTPRPVEFLPGYAGTSDLVVGSLAIWGFGCARANIVNSLQCWGDDSAGQLGIAETPDECTFIYGPDAGTTVTACARKPGPVPNLVNVEAVAAGNLHVCAVVGGKVWCWGGDFEHALGVDPPPDVCSLDDGSQIGCAKSPHAVPGIDDVKSLALGLFHTCALRADGSVWCWGGNGYGQLGDGSGAQTRVAPMPVVW